VAPGANHEVGASDAACAAQGSPDVLVISAEVPVAAIRAALAQARGHQVRAQPGAGPDVPPEAAAVLADGVDWLVVNESEAGAVLAGPSRACPRHAWPPPNSSRGRPACRGHRGRARRRAGCRWP